MCTGKWWLSIQRGLCQGCYCPLLLKGVGVTIFDKHLIAINWREKRNWILTQWGEIISELVLLFLCFSPVDLYSLEFWKIKLENSSLTNWIFTLQKSSSKLDFYKLIFQKSSTDLSFVKYSLIFIATYRIWSILLQFLKISEYDFKEDINPLCSTMVAVSLHLS